MSSDNISLLSHRVSRALLNGSFQAIDVPGDKRTGSHPRTGFRGLRPFIPVLRKTVRSKI